MQPYEPTQIITVLLFAGLPEGTSPLRLEGEQRRIRDALKRSGRRAQFRFLVEPAVTIPHIRRALLEHKPQIVQFCGHDAAKAGIVCEDDRGRVKLIPTGALANLFKLVSSSVKCVILNYCFSEVQANEIAKHIDFVIGMNSTIGEKAASSFSEGFFDAFFAGETIPECFKWGVNAIQLEGIPEDLTPVLKTTRAAMETAEISNQSAPLRYWLLREPREILFGQEEWAPGKVWHFSEGSNEIRASDFVYVWRRELNEGILGWGVIVKSDSAGCSAKSHALFNDDIDASEIAAEFEKLGAKVGDFEEPFLLARSQVIALNKLISMRNIEVPTHLTREQNLEEEPTRPQNEDAEHEDNHAGRLLPGVVLHDRYRIIRLLAKGTTSAVYETLDTRLTQTVVVKETICNDGHQRSEVEREARLLAQLDHPALPRTTDYFSKDDRLFIVTNFISGTNIGEMIANKSDPLPRNQVIAWADQLLDALVYLHSQRPPIIQCYINPHNLQLTKDGRITLVGFGQPTKYRDRVVAHGDEITPQYMHPEQIEVSAEPQSDIYSLGATIYYLFTAAEPADSLARAKALANSQPDPLKPANEIYSPVGEEISAILGRAMALKPEDRYSSAKDFREAFRFVGSRSVERSIIDSETVEILGSHSRILQIKEEIRRVAPTDVAVLIEGETGTGKELVARAIHNLSTRGQQPFVAVNCSAISETLLESELFGHGKGSVGSARKRDGLFEVAHHGTIFLDEIGDLPPMVQVELLRVLQELTVRPIGARQDIPVDVRVIAATNRDLRQMVKEGRFREDLFYRIRVAAIELPPLRERSSDIAELAAHFIAEFRQEYGRSVTMNSSTLRLLEAHSWPGNVRELRAVIRRAAALSEGGILSPHHLGETFFKTAHRSGVGRDESREERFTRANDLEERARDLLVGHAYQQAQTELLRALELDPARTNRVNEEFAFVFDALKKSTEGAVSAPFESAKLRWQTSVWSILSERNKFDLRSLSESPSPLEQIQHQTDVTGVALPSDVNSEQRGELLEQAVLRLFKQFFRLGDKDDGTFHLKKLRQQRRGTQFGFDIAVEFDCVLEWNGTIRCHVECKNYADTIALKDIADKLISQSHFDAEIDLWILISPNADPSNELEQILESSRQRKTYPFDVRVWSPATGVSDFFGLEPSVYDLFFQSETEDDHPRNWTTEKRVAVHERWRDELSPPLRLPKGWDRYLRTPYLLCMRREESRLMESTFANHVTMQCKNEARALMPRSLDYYIRDWLTQRSEPVLFLLGDFGDGKTFFTYTLSRHLAGEFLKDPKSGWIPLRLSLRDFYDAGQSSDFLRLRLSEFGADLEGWTELKARKHLLVILDGFDEISKHLDPISITKNITALVKCYEEFEGCKVLITSRTHFFERRQDVKRLMTRLHDPIIYYLAPIPRGITLYHLETSAQELQLDHSIAKLKSLHDPIGLAAKPLFLQMLKDTLHDLPDDLDEVTLYEKYISNTLQRKAEQLDDEVLLVDRNELLGNLMLLLQEIAVELQVSKKEYVSLNEFAVAKQKKFAQLLWRMAGSEADEEDARARVGVRSLLSRVETEDMESQWTVDFCHRSVREYFVSRALCSSFTAGIAKAEQYLSDVPLNHEILDFAAINMKKASQGYQQALVRIIGGATLQRSPGRLGGNAITLLYRLVDKLPETDWTCRVFDHADLEGADLSEMNFRGSSFRFANLTNVNFEDSHFEGCDFTGVRIEETAAVRSITVSPSGDAIFAVYDDGTAREWAFKHPRKVESRTLAEHLPLDRAMIGSLTSGCLWMRQPNTFTLMNFEDGDLQPIAWFPVKDGYRFETISQSEISLVQVDPSGDVQLLLIDLDQQEIIGRLRQTSATLCVALGRGALAFDDGDRGLSIVAFGPNYQHKKHIPLADRVTCISSKAIGENLHLLACGQSSGAVNVWAIDLATSPVVKEVLKSRIHDGTVTTITFLDELRIVSGGHDRAISVTRMDMKGKTPTGFLERKLQLKFRCKGMQINGLKGNDERQKLNELILKAESKSAND